MECPHCRNTIHDLGPDPTQRDPNGELVLPVWLIKAFCCVVAALVLVQLHMATTIR
jgi:hypothetical protein